MGIFQNIKSLLSGSAAPPPASAAAPSGLSGPKMDFTTSSDGQTERSIWARYSGPINVSMGPYTYASGGHLEKDRVRAAATATNMSTANSTVATIVLNGTTHAVGTGLTLSSKIDAAALGIDPADARALSTQIEKAWKRYAGSAIEVDASGRHDLHQIVAAAYETWQRGGEALIAIDWMQTPHSKVRTKVRFLDPALLDNTKTISGENGDYTLRGVTFDKRGRVKGYWINNAVIAHPVTGAISKYEPAFTPWGQPRIIHVFQLQTPGQVRGASPLTSALTPAQAKDTLGEFTLDQAITHAQYAATLESQLPAQQALNSLRTDDGISTGAPATAGSAGTVDQIAMRADWYANNKISMKPGVVNALPAGDRLRINRSESPNSTYDAFDKSLGRSAAKAAGASAEDTSGDYSDTSFSASRLSMETPHRINLRRRKDIAEAIYKGVFHCWLAEALETGAIKLPAKAPAFHAARDVYLESKWLGSGRIVADPLKNAQAVKLMIDEGLLSRSDALAEMGLDFETTVEERKYERETLEAAGLWNPQPSTVPADPEEDDPQPKRKQK